MHISYEGCIDGSGSSRYYSLVDFGGGEEDHQKEAAGTTRRVEGLDR
jgi:hypothetical protein